MVQLEGPQDPWLQRREVLKVLELDVLWGVFAPLRPMRPWQSSKGMHIVTLIWRNAFRRLNITVLFLLVPQLVVVSLFLGELNTQLPSSP